MSGPDKLPFPQPSLDSFELYEIPHFFTDELCERLIQFQKTNPNTPGRILSSLLIEPPRPGVLEWISNDPSIRISEKAILSKELSDEIEIIISNRFCIDKEYIEPDIRVVHYPTGGKLNAHYDTVPSLQSYRAMTMIVYLNDDFIGGETDFPRLGKSVRPEKGKAAFFWDTLPDHRLLVDSVHSSKLITSGEKWVINVWFHWKKFKK
jgi:hypothetical protein